MALITADRVRDTTTTTGTGAKTVSGTAPTGYRTFSAVLAVNDTFLGMIAHQTQNEWEVGLYTYSASNQITGTTLLASSTGSPISFSAGTKDVILTQNAERMVLGTDLTSPIIYGGEAANSSLILQSTSGAGSSDFVSFRTGNSGIEGLQVDTNQDIVVKTNQKITDYATNSSPTITPDSGTFTAASAVIHYWRCGKFMYVTGELYNITKGTAAGNVKLSVPGGATIAQQGIGTLWDRAAGNVGTALVQFDPTNGIYLRFGSAGPLATGQTWDFAGGFTVA